MSPPPFSLASFVPSLIFQCIYFILRPRSLSLKHHKKGREKQKREQKEKLEFRYGRGEEMAKGKGEKTLSKRMQLRRKLLWKNKAGKTFTVFESGA